ncbi:SusC/RagA family TonB-linked outer membrane protein [Gramella sp. MAR_2010_147]|uniref:SusC/RagA family TonB-linked outer membrane protein n=1 Tax=Gramella sp. MAR_2010_147 TaxID=1250205 RepID=UPI00087921FA|nr:SusC/RagA family TonB-linked outer membrane protein [Gramella sp. MAR_2010_147]SDS52651.1 TonB-linked outer membrane protein, SusC/RagA family [Gramella sp. MAR_2010_147]
MKKRLHGFLTLLLVLVVQIGFAQEKTVTGTVVDDQGLPLPGVNVIIKGTSSGTQSDFDGNYSIQVDEGETLVFSFVGMMQAEYRVGASNTVNVEMTVDSAQLDEVVVTALGIERSEKSLGYGVSTVKSEELNEVRETNVLNALQAKSSGVLIQNQSGNVGGSTRITIRGISSLSGDVQPLFVVDGVPISNSNIASGSRITGGFDFGNRAQDINPDDIASVTVLKGASAAALYGSRASGGVIVITTKKGKAGRAASFQASSSVRFDDPLKLPDFQNSYVFGDQGELTVDPEIPINADGAAAGLPGWGPNINDVSGQTYTNVAGEVVPFEIYPNNVEGFYETGLTNINSFNVSGASEGGEDDYRLSLSQTTQEGIIPNSALNRLNLGVNAGSQLSETLKSRLNFNYVRTNTQGTAAAGANDPNVLTNIVNGLPRTTDIGLFDPDIDEMGNQLNPVGLQTNNPYFIARRNAAETTVERFFGSAQIEFEPIEKLNFLGRAGYDSYTDQRLTKNSIGTLGRFNGSYRDDFIQQRELTLDFIASYDWIISDDFNIQARAGTQWNQRVLNRTGNVATGLTVPGLLDPGNADNNSPFKAFSDRRIHGVFGDITFDYKGWAFLNATGRNDWSSTLPANNRSFFYPSVSASVVLSDALNFDSNVLNYLKVRGSWANVGVDTSPYLLDFTFNPLTSFFGQFGTGGTYPFNGNLAFGSDSSITNQNLKPENQENYEFGIEFGFFRNRVTIDATYYKNTTTDQIIFLPTPQTSGFSSFLTNIGAVSNEGVELEVGARVLQTDDFSWDLNYNFTSNQFNVDDLGDLPALNLATGFNGIAVRAVEGESLQLYGPRFERALDEDGEPIEDQILVNENGNRQVGAPDNLGEIFPDYIMGLTSTWRYKGFALTTTFDYREGGKLFSNTVGQLRRDGLAAETAANGRAPIVDSEAFMMDESGNVVPNTIETSAQDYWTNYANASIVEGNVFDATFIKWRELSLTYTFPSEFLTGTFVKGVRVGAQARNLAIFNSDVPHIDPEASLGGASSDLQGIERGGVPSTRSVGMNVSINF